jgi:hypothetical protein
MPSDGERTKAVSFVAICASSPMERHMTWFAVNCLMMVFLLIAMARVGTRPSERGYLPGLVLMAIAVTGILLRELFIPRHFWLGARMVEVAMAILGFVLVVRMYIGMSGFSKKR